MRLHAAAIGQLTRAQRGGAAGASENSSRKREHSKLVLPDTSTRAELVAHTIGFFHQCGGSDGGQRKERRPMQTSLWRSRSEEGSK